MADADRFADIDRLFQRVCELPPDRQQAALAEHETDHPEVVAEVRRLLEAEREHASAFEAALDRPVPADPDAPLPERVGAYRIIAKLGDGGMGVVYEAEQDSPRRRVALKLIRPGLLSSALLRRFEFESQTLGRLKHPGIAQIYESGAAPTGEPFFALELVEGRPLLEHGAAYSLSTRRRLELFTAICDAVHHAHQKGVVHRDLKPANILVTPEGAPKILDFGVARLVASEVESVTMNTSPGQIVGTLAYMSPEQATSNADSVDTRADVYALGVVLYELLTGSLPIEIGDATVYEALRRVQEQAPARLGSVAPALRGDLETIVAKAIEKDPARRYAGVSEFRADIVHFLRDEPISARPPSTLYQLRMFTRRHRPLVLAVAAAALVLVAGVVVSSVLAVERTMARNAARDERDAALRVNEFLTRDLLAAAMPENLGRDVTVREAVDVAAASIGDEFRDRPLIQASIEEAIGLTYSALGQWDRAEDYLTRTRASYTRSAAAPDRVLGARLALARLSTENGDYDETETELADIIAQAQRDPATADLSLQARTVLAVIQRERGEYEASLRTLRDALEQIERRHGSASEQAVLARSRLAQTLIASDQREEAMRIQRGLVDDLLEREGEGDPSTIASLANLGLLLLEEGELDESEAALTRAMTLAREHLGPEHPITVIYTANLGTFYSQRGQSDKAAPILQSALDFADQVLGPTHPLTMGCVSSLGVVYAQQGLHARAAPLLNRAADDLRNELGETNPRTITAKANAITTYVNAGEYETAEPICRQAIADAARDLGPDNDSVQVLTNTLAVIQFRSERYREAERTWSDARRMVAKALPEGHMRLHMIDASRGMALVRLGEFERAEALLVPAYEAIRQATGPTSYFSTRFAIGMIELYEGTGREELAEKLRQTLPEGTAPGP